MAAPARSIVHNLLERAHSPDTASQIYADKIQHREQFLRPTSPGGEEREGASASAAASIAAAAAASAAAELAAIGASGHNGRDARRRSRRLKQEQRQRRARALKPKPLSSRQRRAMEKAAASDSAAGKANKKATSSYATFLPLHRLWLGYVREVLGPQELRTGGAAAAAKLTAADFHGALVEVTRSTCVGRVGTRGIVVRDTRFVFEVVTPANEVKMVPKEGTFFRIEIPAEANEEEDAAAAQDEAAAPADTPKLVVEILGSQFMHRATDRANRKFKQHFYREL